MRQTTGLRELGDLLWRAVLHALLFGIAGLVGIILIFAGPYAEGFSEIVKTALGGILMIPAIAGPVVLIATAVFGTPAALLVRKFSIGRWMSLVVILGFACLPMLLAMFWAGNWEMDSLPQAGRGLLISGLFAVPAALSLWRGLTGKRQQADAPTIS